MKRGLHERNTDLGHFGKQCWEWSNLHNTEFHNFYTPQIVTMTESGTVRWVRHAAFSVFIQCYATNI